VSVIETNILNSFYFLSSGQNGVFAEVKLCLFTAERMLVLLVKQVVGFCRHMTYGCCCCRKIGMGRFSLFIEGFV